MSVFCLLNRRWMGRISTRAVAHYALTIHGWIICEWPTTTTRAVTTPTPTCHPARITPATNILPCTTPWVSKTPWLLLRAFIHSKVKNKTQSYNYFQILRINSDKIPLLYFLRLVELSVWCLDWFGDFVCSGSRRWNEPFGSCCSFSTSRLASPWLPWWG